MGSLQDALLKSGLTNEEKIEQARKRKNAPPPQSRRPQPKSSARALNKKAGAPGRAINAQKTAPVKPARAEKSDLEKAWIARRKVEQAEKERVKQARVADQEARRQRNLKLDQIVEGRALNLDDAETPRYFEHLGRIRRVMCSKEQRDGLNQGVFGLVNLRGRYLIVEPEVLEAYRKLADDLVPDLTGAEPEDQSELNDYPAVPDDITW